MVRGVKETAEGRRILIHVSIHHARQDMGRLGESLPTRRGYDREVEDYWRQVTQRVKALGQDWRRVKVYQDGLPDTEPHLLTKIVDQASSPNYELLRWLKEQGATLVGTESIALLAEEYAFLRAIYEAENEAVRKRALAVYQGRRDGLLGERDSYIAERIGKKVAPGETAILLIGKAHRVTDKLPEDIRVEELGGLEEPEPLE